MRPADPASGEAAAPDRSWHIERARAELDAGYRAAGGREAAIHLKLCALHMERAGWQRRPSAQLEADWMRRCSPLHVAVLAEA
ncbi:MAG TPA: hypothetical protein VGB70_01775 [Allosphingosinicella sp.]|jgi:hypothetical protein